MAASFELVSKREPAGDQPQAIARLVEGFRAGKACQTLRGAAGIGRTLTCANVIAQIDKPTLVLTPSRTFAAQVYQALRSLFPHNAVHIFIGQDDGDQPETYIPRRDIHIERDRHSNENLDRLRLDAIRALVCRADVIVVASVSCLHGLESPSEIIEWMLHRARSEQGIQEPQLTADERIRQAVEGIGGELEERLKQFREEGKLLEAQRLEARTRFDLEMLLEAGHCPGVENYARWLSDRKPGAPPCTLLDFFPEDFLMVVDESHVTLPQARDLFDADHSRKLPLVEHGFRLPSALDNRPLRFDEWEKRAKQVLFLSATPAAYELERSGGAVVEQSIDPESGSNRSIVDAVEAPDPAAEMAGPKADDQVTQEHLEELHAELLAVDARMALDPAAFMRDRIDQLKEPSKTSPWRKNVRRGKKAPSAEAPPPDMPRLPPRPGSATAREQGPTRGDPVDCTVFAPPRVAAGDALLVQVFAHLPEQGAAVEELARQLDEDAQKRGFKSLEVEIARGSRLTFHLVLPGLVVDEPVQHLIWQGRPASVAHGVSVPPEQRPGTIIGTVSVSQDSVPLGHIKFKLSVTPAGAEAGPAARAPAGVEARRYRKAFISYASADRVEVLKRVQMLRHFGIDFFQDVLDLEPGSRWEQQLYRHIDDSDLFLLFWSSSAQKSQWVLQEIRYALGRKGSDELAPPEIAPVILEGPPPAPPPAELAHLHFNDYLMYFIGK